MISRFFTATKVKLPIVLATAGVVTLGTTAAVLASDDGAHVTSYPWFHNKFFSGLDHGSMRRGFQVYKEICSACHSLNYVAFRTLVGNTHTVGEAKAIAEDYEINDGPDDQGNMFARPGKLSDHFTGPYANEEAARFANGGAYPPDLSLLVKARHSGEDYIFSILTGYYDPPAGISIREGLHYNPYFPGGAIAMARPLYDGMVEYEDGTPATTSQMAKDVVNFLTWAAEPKFDERRIFGIKSMLCISIATAFAWYFKRHKWSIIKSRKLIYNPPNFKD